MKYINYREDFKLAMQLRDADGGPCAVPDFDFTIRLKAGPREYFAGRFDGVLKNCIISDADSGELVIVCDNHNLLPCQELIAEVTYHLPDGDHPDGERSTTAVYHTGISLTINESSVPSKAEFEALLPFIKGERGDRGESSVMGHIRLVTDKSEYLVPFCGEEIVDVNAGYYGSGYYNGDGGEWPLWGIWDIDLIDDIDNEGI